MVDLDSNPTKLIEIVEIGKQLLMTRGALTTFSIANDVAKYFAIIPAAFASTYPVLDALNVMQLATPASAILSAVIFNALIIPALIPLALRGVKYRAVGAGAILRAEHADLRRRRHPAAVRRHQDRSTCCSSRCTSPDARRTHHVRTIRSPALRMLVVLSVLTGVVYPYLVTGHRAGRVSARRQRQPDRGRRQGASDRALIGQPFDDPKYFWSRPSATSPQPYNGAASSGSNQGPRNPGARRRGQGSHQGAARRGSGQQAPPCRSISSRRRRSGLDPAHQRRRRRAIRWRASPRRAACRRTRCAHSSTQNTRGPHVRHPRRAARQRARAEPRARSRGQVGAQRGGVAATGRLPRHERADCNDRRPRMHDRRRPDPDQLLAQVKAQEAAARRGRLRIYFGASAGVGKTYAMLTAARALRNEGKDVVVGVVETHGRKETEALLQGLEVLPRAKIAYQDRTLAEFDLDAALARRPALILVDELAHTNVAGLAPSRSAGRTSTSCSPRGIDVFTTLNVQHLESLNDVVGGITGITRLGDGARHLLRPGRRSGAGRHLGRRPARAPQGRQGLPARADRARAAQLLPQGQPDGAARARAAPHRRSRRGRRPGLSLRQVDRARLEDRGFAAVLHRSRSRRRRRRAQRRAARHAARRRVDRRLRRDAGAAAAAGARARAHPADGQARAGVRREDRDPRRRRSGAPSRRVRADAQLLEDGRRAPRRRVDWPWARGTAQPHRRRSRRTST